MDEAETADYVEPCALCSNVNWAIGADLKYYCKSCHNVIDKSRQAYTKAPMGSEVPPAARAQGPAGEDPAGALSASQTGGSSASETDEGPLTNNTEGGQHSAISSGASSGASSDEGESEGSIPDRGIKYMRCMKK
ncbi:hypothetical protein CRUP_025877 [Coryphaenoides rupestris]|nr:hypothetical protein CRUP_025877 [Coryphaenoides rupestris]